MLHLHVAALEPDAEFAKKIGKKGSESDFSIYNCKEGDRVLCIYHASKYPEKIQPLLYSLSLCDLAYLRPQSIDRYVGEMIVACAVFGRKVIVVSDRVGRSDVEPLLVAAGLKEYEFFEGDANALRERLLSEKSLRRKDGAMETVIDSCFPVKGVGTVALGIVQQGTAKVHQKIVFSPSGASAEIKSIQVQDENAGEAEAGSRVGFCLKGVEPEKVGKGELACESAVPAHSKISGAVSLSKFFKGNLETVQFFVLWGLKFVACKGKLSAGKLEIELASPLPVRVGENLPIFLPEAMPRAIGKLNVEKAC